MRAPLAAALLIGAALAVPADAGAATLSGADGDVWNAADPAPTYTVTATRGSRVEWRLEGRGGGWTRGRSPLVVVLGPIADGRHLLLARDRRGGDDDDEDDEEEGGGRDPARRSFRVDTAAPTIAVVEPRAGASYALGQVVPARYSCAGAVECAAPVPDGQPLATNRAGPATFVVRALDDAGNAAALDVSYAVAPAPAAAPAGLPGATPARLLDPRPPRPPETGLRRLASNHRRLSPALGSRLSTLRPLLRWRPHARARLYNVQVFEVAGTSVRKVLSTFPAGPRLRVPARTLARGRSYAWRVWPYMRGGYPRSPIGVSTFAVSPARARGS